MRHKRGSSGRPRLCAGPVKMVRLRVGAADLVAIDARARSAGLSRSAFLRRAALAGQGGLMTAEERAALREAMAQLRLAGVNLNSLVRDNRLAERGVVMPPDRERLASVLEALEAARAVVDGALAPLRRREAGDA